PRRPPTSLAAESGGRARADPGWVAPVAPVPCLLTEEGPGGKRRRRTRASISGTRRNPSKASTFTANLRNEHGFGAGTPRRHALEALALRGRPVAGARHAPPALGAGERGLLVAGEAVEHHPLGALLVEDPDGVVPCLSDVDHERLVELAAPPDVQAERPFLV